MGETIPTWKPTCNPSASIQLSGRKTSSDPALFMSSKKYSSVLLRFYLTLKCEEPLLVLINQV